MGKVDVIGCLPATFDYLSPAIMTDQVMNTEIAT